MEGASTPSDRTGAIVLQDTPDLTVILNTFHVILVHVLMEEHADKLILSTISAPVLLLSPNQVLFFQELSTSCWNPFDPDD
ncbi:hypothetical protein TNIN_121501 [Trichonephila inaurata madagascariensis]|uniref:Uncharacterized protein n=1 Tax=Trichonephila inaurata madagascariensis TaxID=2747483 RepID=A0A8X7C9I5_9ARAC|nr:hypothetical protein TNIN_121501 [Trichonephila inaurata madagascariensis]